LLSPVLILSRDYRLLRSAVNPIRVKVQSETWKCSRQDAKNAKFGLFFFLALFAAFARNDPTFGCGFAAL
jgi:hypothetical protein